MSTVKEIESAITQLEPSEVHAVADWLQEYREKLWDKQMAADAQAGKLDPLNQAVDRVRRVECGRLRGRPQATKLKHMRWKLLRCGNRVRGHAKQRLHGLLRGKLATGRAWMLKESFPDFWHYHSLTWAAAFLEVWCERARRSRIEPLRKIARMLRAHEELILNWFRAKGEISNGPVEALNNKIRVITRRSYGFRTCHAMETALYHNLGRLPEPELTHSFC